MVGKERHVCESGGEDQLQIGLFLGGFDALLPVVVVLSCLLYSPTVFNLCFVSLIVACNIQSDIY